MQAATHSHPGQGSQENDRRKRVLVVEDDPDFSTMLRDYLESYYYEVIEVSNGVEALRRIMERDVDAVICDLVMPTMPGDMFYYAVQRVKPQLCERFIFITSHGESPSIRDFLNQVSEMVLMKPFHLDDLLQTMLSLFRELEDRPNHLEIPPGPTPIRRVDDHRPGPAR